MALVTRYFDVVGAGTQDGTTYANRAPLFVAGSFNTIISGFNFTAAVDGLYCLVEPGIYTTTNPLIGFSSGTPAKEYPLIFVANGFVPPVGWSSALPPWDKTNSGMVRVQCTIHTNSLGSVWTTYYGFSFEYSALNGSIVSNNGTYFHWCLFENTAPALANTQVMGTASSARNCCMTITGSNYSQLAGNTSGEYINCRFYANPSASSGNRWMNFSSTNLAGYSYCTLIGYNGMMSTRLTSSFGSLFKCTMVMTGFGIDHDCPPPSTTKNLIDSCFIVTGGDGIIIPNSTIITNNRLRCGGTEINTSAQSHVYGNFTDAGSDAAEFVDAANGDYRIKYGSAYWGKGIGAGDEPARFSYGSVF